MRATLALPQELLTELTAAAQEPLETAGVLLASVVKVDGDTVRLLGRSMEWVGSVHISSASPIVLQ